MTIDEHLAAIAATLHALAEAQLRTQTATEGLVRAQTQTQETIGSMATSIGKYVDAADARMKRLEENLDGLIRAITAEHSNGKSKHQ
jgi:ABC-type transporter Mla subunit MlaD